MGSLDVKAITTREEQLRFTHHLLRDIEALEWMLRHGMIATAPIHIGAEQEMALVDAHWRPYPINLKVLETLDDPAFTTELAKFNMEVNFDPLELKGAVFSELEKTMKAAFEKALAAAGRFDGQVVLTGILPTIRRFDVELDNLTPLERYRALLDAISRFRGGDFELKLRGTDEINIVHDSAMLEACNTSFQVHLQVTPEDFARKYNYSQAVAGACLAAAVNSPLLFGKRLWHETRIALFQQSVDTRPANKHLRDRAARVTFGNNWVTDILDIYREDAVRYRPMLTLPEFEDSVQAVKEGRIPSLKALSIHNSTVYRWNRACYGTGGDKPHIRIENRIFPAGPTIRDEVANAAFWIGLMEGMEEAYGDITQLMPFDDAKASFFTAAINGIDSSLRWIKGQRLPAWELIKNELLPVAREGLKKRGVAPSDIDTYLGLIEARVASRQTGAHWILESYKHLMGDLGREEMLTAIVAATAKYQQQEIPGHLWPLAEAEDIPHWEPSQLLVEEFMTTDLFTAHPDDAPEFIADMMDWKRIRYVPIENSDGKLIGLVTSRMLLRFFRHRSLQDTPSGVTAGEIMIKDPITIAPESLVRDAMEIMNEKQIGCLPVVKNQRLVGIITEQDFLKITRSLMRRMSSFPPSPS